MSDDIDLGAANLTDLRAIGRGGFSNVFSALDTQFDRAVAVKVLTRSLDEADQRRFDRECRVMGRLSRHPNVATVYHAGYSPDGLPYLVMELVEGGSLADRLAHGAIPWREAVSLIIPVAGAVGAAHEAGILHRDIKPENILLADDGPRLTDFGIAYLRDATAATSTQITASWLHTPPETFDNMRDERSDVYSLGSTLFATIAGKAPFWNEGEDSLNPLLRRLLAEPAPHLDAGLAPPQLDAEVQRSLAKNPDDRQQSTAEFVAAIHEITDLTDVPRAGVPRSRAASTIVVDRHGGAELPRRETTDEGRDEEPIAARPRAAKSANPQRASASANAPSEATADPDGRRASGFTVEKLGSTATPEARPLDKARVARKRTRTGRRALVGSVAVAAAVLIGLLTNSLIGAANADDDVEPEAAGPTTSVTATTTESVSSTSATSTTVPPPIASNVVGLSESAAIAQLEADGFVVRVDRSSSSSSPVGSVISQDPLPGGDGANATIVVSTGPADQDNDGVPDDGDNCPTVQNSEQEDLDGDEVGDPCDSDLDGDGVANGDDNCPAISNSDQIDEDEDEVGAPCDDWNDPRPSVPSFVVLGDIDETCFLEFAIVDPLPDAGYAWDIDGQAYSGTVVVVDTTGKAFLDVAVSVTDATGENSLFDQAIGCSVPRAG